MQAYFYKEELCYLDVYIIIKNFDNGNLNFYSIFE